MKESSNSKVASYKTYSKTTKSSRYSMNSRHKHMISIDRTELPGLIQEEALDVDDEVDG